MQLFSIPWRAAALLATFSLSSFAGQLWMEFGNPQANSDPKAKGAALVVRAMGCGDPAKAAFSGTAEGVVNGKRVSAALKFTALTQPGMYAVSGEGTGPGAWVAVITTTESGRVANAVAPLDGSRAREAKVFARKLETADIDSALPKMGN
jgi:hypothetical protein